MLERTSAATTLRLIELQRAFCRLNYTFGRPAMTVCT